LINPKEHILGKIRVALRSILYDGKLGRLWLAFMDEATSGSSLTLKSPVDVENPAFKMDWPFRVC
jgi:hypothetical protein